MAQCPIYNIDELRGDKFVSQIQLESNKTYKEAEIISLIKTCNPSVSDTRVKWILFDMEKRNQITRVGVKEYIPGSGRIYNHEFESTIAKRIDDIIKDSFPLLKTVVWELTQLNEWTNLLFSKNTIFIEIESGFESIVFDELIKSLNDKMVLLNPNSETIARYMRDELIVVKRLFSRSPVSKRFNSIMLEKLVVDVIADKYLSSLLGTGNIECIVKGIKKNYTINKSKMFAYAKRRKVEELLRDTLEK